MWFLRGLLLVSISSVLLHEADGWTTIDKHLKVAAYDTLHSIWAKLMEQGVAMSKYIVQARDSGRQGRSLVSRVTDDNVDRAVAVFKLLTNEYMTLGGTGRSGELTQYFKDWAYVVMDYFTKLWGDIKASLRHSVDSFLDWNALLTNWFFAPAHTLMNFVNRPYSRRARSIHEFYDRFWKEYIFVSKAIFTAMVNIPADIVKRAVTAVTGREINAARSIGDALAYQVKNDFLRNSREYSGNIRTIYGQKYHRILEGFGARELTMANEAINLLTFALWSGTGFHAVYSELINECYKGNDLLEYTLIEGDSYVEDSYLHAIMDAANTKRQEACTFYRSAIGEDNSTNVFSFVSDKFGELMKTTHDHTSLAPADVVTVDAVAQSMLGNGEPVCMLRVLCMAGFANSQDKNSHPGVPLLFGLVVSGRTDFNGILSHEHVRSLGTPKMAEAIYRGYNNECDVYTAPRGSDCANTGMFMYEYVEEQKQDAE